MMESPCLEEEKIIKDVRNLFRLEKLKKKKQLIPQFCYICKEKSENKWGTVYGICNLKYSLLKKFLQVCITDLTMIITLS